MNADPYEHIFDKEGRPVSIEEWSRLHADLDYIRVGSTEVGPYWVSTVWLGMDHRFFGEGPPIIFETMVFLISQRDDPEGGLTDFDCVRYCTEEEARKGHEDMVTLVRATTQEEFDGAELPGGPADGPVDEGQGRTDQGGDREGTERQPRGGGTEVQRPRPPDEDRDPG